ncbi:MAG TPA: hypothetical protein VK629_12520 [Steroidobacteraceae bacterium]|nr:hypothetical protein [Steroidobacteraceae bacterium]
MIQRDVTPFAYHFNPELLDALAAVFAKAAVDELLAELDASESKDDDA